MNEKLLTTISKKLDLLAALLLESLSEQKSNAEKIELLDKFDLSNAEIATVAGMTEPAVRMARSRMKKGTQK
ncbi:hypothetical protein RAAC3_TM7C00001G0904 [Candidatus Saccharibacteria bacterium RAAC3_TM7_1]|nr:hypothetical protein RAAC3_TM7C00001G0904 [Candidatus Saccharibacteria bacterium RAAC3_TM7_1]HCZ28191.1 hypothetical protein [Candidatus Saccharibacteria bacterium]